MVPAQVVESAEQQWGASMLRDSIQSKMLRGDRVRSKSIREGSRHDEMTTLCEVRCKMSGTWE
jgi:hypothetical protein